MTESLLHRLARYLRNHAELITGLCVVASLLLIVPLYLFTHGVPDVGALGRVTAPGTLVEAPADAAAPEGTQTPGAGEAAEEAGVQDAEMLEFAPGEDAP